MVDFDAFDKMMAEDNFITKEENAKSCNAIHTKIMQRLNALKKQAHIFKEQGRRDDLGRVSFLINKVW